MFSQNEIDELLQCFLAESVEHLEGIEPLILQLETAPEEERLKLTNHVFRAAHSIKGSSGMFGFTNIHELSHKTEWLLDFLRSDRLEPTSDIIDLLLQSFDRLRNLVDNAAQSNAIEIADVVAKLESVLHSVENGGQARVSSASASVPADKTAPGHCQTSMPTPQLFSFPETDIDAARKSGLLVFFARFDLIAVIDKPKKSLLDFLKLLHGLGQVMAFHFDVDAFIESQNTSEPVLPVEILYNSVIGSSEINGLLEIPEGTLCLLKEPCKSADVVAPFARASETMKPAATESLKPGVEESAAGTKKRPAVEQHPSEAIQVAEKTEPTLRVKVSLLEDLMNLAGELVLSRNQLREGLSRNDMRAIRISGQRMGQVTSELQETIMMTRLQPLDRVFSKFPRMIRDISRQLQKDILLTMEGKEVELDKTLIEGLADPLTHMIRNAADHGVEAPEERSRLGKPNPARIKLQAFYEASRVIIEVADDGRGIDGEKVCAKAVERGLITADKARTLSMREKQGLIVLPGLSTADKVSELSGRGVGMDVVKANVDSLGGKIEIVSEMGKGTSFKIKLPLTLAIIPSLILTTSREMFAIPQINVLEMLLIPAEMIKRRIEILGNHEVLVLRGKLLPLVSMNQFLGVPETFVDPETGEEKLERRHRLSDRRSLRRDNQSVDAEARFLPKDSRGPDRRYHAASGINVVVVTTGSFVFGLVVDKPLYTEEIVVKQLGNDLKGLIEYSGATILGDGRIALIIDVLGLATRANILGQQHASTSDMADSMSDFKPDSENVPLLAFRYGGPETLVVPLFLVSRLEKISHRDVVSSGGWKAIHHGDRLLPVFFLSDLGYIQPLRPDQECGVIVVRVKNREIGLIAALPIQVIETRPDLDPTVLKQPGIGGSKVWNWKSMLFVDIWEIVALSRPELLEHDIESSARAAKAKRILVLEQCEYYLHQTLLQIENHGFTPVPARNWVEAGKMLAEMPFKAMLVDQTFLTIDGFSPLQNLRRQKGCKDLQVAVTGLHAGEICRQFAAEGVSHFFQKLDNQQLPVWLGSLNSDNQKSVSGEY